MTLQQFLPAPAEPPQQPVLVAAADLPVGHRLTEASLQVQATDAGHLPAGSMAHPSRVLGRVLVAPVGRGEPITESRLRVASQLTGLGGSTRALYLPLVDRSLPALLQPGDRVDVITVADGRTVAADLLVIGVPGIGAVDPAGPPEPDGDGTGAAEAGGSAGLWPAGSITGPGVDQHGSGSGVMVAAPVDKVGALTRAALSDTPSTGVHVALRIPEIR